MNTVAETYRGSPIRVLLVEDEQGIAEILRRGCADMGWQLEHCATLASGRRLLDHDRDTFDAVLLDLGLPDGDGLELCRHLRATSTVPILILTARRAEVDRIVGLELGADDYIVKPFSPREVIARISAVLRRQGWARAPSETVHRCGDLEVDEDRFEARVRGAVIQLTRTEFRLLATLARRPGMVFTRQQLVDAAWDGAFIQDRVVDSVVSRVRRKLGDSAVLRTVHGVGYALDSAADTGGS